MLILLSITSGVALFIVWRIYGKPTWLCQLVPSVGVLFNGFLICYDYIASVVDEWIVNREKTDVFEENHVPVPVKPTQTPHGPAWLWTLSSNVRSRRLAAWARAPPSRDVMQMKCRTELHEERPVNMDHGKGSTLPCSLDSKSHWAPNPRPEGKLNISG